MSENMNILKIRLRDARFGYRHYVAALRTLSGSLKDRTFGHYPEPDTPELLYRAFENGCHGRHSKELGFRSSDQPLSHPVYHDGTLLDSMIVDEEVLRNHCERIQPSNLIALSDSPSRILKIIQALRYPDMDRDMIAVINTSRLLAMGVLFNRTTTFAEKFGMELWKVDLPTGLQYANYNYWVAYRWIPAECIECYISGSCLREACDRLGIAKNDSNARLSLDEILPLRFQSLST
ncbi:hypothetical protein ACJ73_04917 [Blastomyces percursus]|uniref:DUF7587 domain-containing protein n=1 Tax=Blastomyces percursus TaxID=1658174 RepID=A0A1J9QU29_9EURO|nr:hypothetical protein ACJ73_04917 [Blastomyces percursus]